MRQFFVAGLLFATGCAANGRDVAVSPQDLHCTFTHGGEDSAVDENVCSIFRETLGSLDRGDITALQIHQVSPTSVQVTAFEQNQQAALKLDFDVMDAQLDEKIWREFARTFARQLETD